jgi:prepilin-type N-terminal cleavage/methylation domain-containing protein
MPNAERTPLQPSDAARSGTGLGAAPRRRHWDRGAAFTLIELLVVVALIALLLSILLPSLGRARQQARAVKCLAQLREVGNGMLQYHTEEHCFPAHQWIFADGTRTRWFNILWNPLIGPAVPGCPATPGWEVGRNNSYGYNYKYLGSGRDNTLAANPYRPLESYPIGELHNAAATIAFGDSDGTGWERPYGPDTPLGDNDPARLGNHGYVLDPTYIPVRSLETYSGGVLEPYAWKFERTYLSDRHLGRAVLIWADGHGSRLEPREAYVDNALWNGLGFDPGDDPQSPWYECDRHVDYKVSPSASRKWRY